MKSRDELLKYQNRKKSRNKIPFITTYHKQIPDIRSTIEKHWNLLQISENLKQVFQNSPVYGFRRNKNLRDIIGQTTLKNNRVVRKNKHCSSGKCTPCRTRNNNLCCNQVLSTSTFKSQQTQEVFQIFHKTNCRSKFVIYLLECKK